ncbi:MAG: glycyl radical protein [Agathobaculum sp.]|jgi:pyruvate formate-lyase/glycerol dehydratase family glycyl radical enzyme|uniref:glycyl radical protein n=1 Tax=Agathobaculum sp. TaxID=2048138 RepID=UPI003D8F9EBB
MEIQSLRCDATPRVQKLRTEVFQSSPKVCAERALLITESYQETVGQPVMLRRAMAMDKILRGVSTPILEGELTVGHLGSMRRSAPVYPEMDITWLERELDDLSTRAYDRFDITDEVKESIRGILPYWRTQSLRDNIFAAMPEETRKARLESGVFSITAHEETGFGHVLLPHERILHEGLSAVIERIEKARAALDLTATANLDKDIFYRAQLITLRAVIAWANRYADEAERQAQEQKDEKRRQELLRIAKTCRRVPEHPARNFQEALQCIWFLHLAPQLETDGVAITIGRLDQFAYPFVREELAQGRAWEDLQEELDCFWLKFAEMVKLYNLASAQVTSGFPMGQNIIVGGTDEYGQDASNDLTYMCFEAHRHCRLYEPNFSVRINTNTDEKFLRTLCENLRMGTGHPVVFNEDIGIASLVSYGIPLKEARNYAPIGCVENTVVEMWMRSNGGYFCLAKVLELAIHNGECQMTHKQVGPKTGYLEDFATFEEFFEALRKQMEFFTRHLVTENNVIDLVHSRMIPIPFVSSLFNSCIEAGKCVTQGGAKYNFTCPGGVGVANLADGLSAIRYLVYDKKRVDAKRLRLALANDFAGEEELQHMLQEEPPRYGNDDPYADHLARIGVDLFLDELAKHKNSRGGHFVAGLTAITANISFGKNVAATPDGRNAGTPLAEGISPAPGRDVKGPTAAMRSVAALDHTRIMKGVIYNQKFNPTVLETPEGVAKFTALLRGYCEIKGAQVQFNVIDRQTLIDAQEHPEQYRDLVVRVAGYSAFYTELSREVQNQIIVRTEFGDV